MLLPAKESSICCAEARAVGSVGSTGNSSTSGIDAEGGETQLGKTRVLVVDDNDSWRGFFSSQLQKQPELQIVGEASDGLEAVQKSQALQPDLILLDVGLPRLNGIEAARQIGYISPSSRILFISENRSIDVVKAALDAGALGYTLKSDAGRELLHAVEAVLDGRQFVSSGLGLVPPDPQITGRRHVVGFYSDDQQFRDHVTQFVGMPLKAGSSAIVVATEAHRESLLLDLQAYGVDVRAAIEQSRYVALDAAETLSAFMVDGMPDRVRLVEVFHDLIMTATGAAVGEHPRVSFFGECVNLLCQRGNVDAAIHLEKIGNQLIQSYDMDILCGYALCGVQSAMHEDVFQQICAEHLAVYSR